MVTFYNQLLPSFHEPYIALHLSDFFHNKVKKGVIIEVLKSQSETQSIPALEFVLGMKGGNGDSSYANNSSPQLKAIQALKPILELGIYENMRLKFDGGGIFRIADFGCGTGQNTLVIAHTITSAVQCLLGEKEMPEFEVYFTDLPSNDFNSLFRMLPPPRERCIDADKNGEATRSYLAAAVCGSHFTRLFSRKSLHFCHSSLSLHWLSQVSNEATSQSMEACRIIMPSAQLKIILVFL